MKTNRIIITIEGGVLQDISYDRSGEIDPLLPLQCVVRDYDIEGSEEDNLSLDENGNECLETIWEPDKGE